MSRENLPTLFLKIGGAVLLILGLVGFTGLFNSVEWFNLDTGENLAHTVLGVVGLGFGFFVKDARINKWLVVVLGVTGLFFGLLGFFLGGSTFANGAFAKPNFLGLANLENPADNLLHLVVGIVAFLAIFYDKPMAAAPAR